MPTETPTLPDKVTLHTRDGELVLDLRVPADLALRYEAAHLVSESRDKCFAACLGLCTDRLGRPGHNLLDFGAQVTRTLLAADVPYTEIVGAGAIAFLTVTRSLPTEPEVAGTAGFTGPTPAGSTSSSSKSNGRGGKRRAGSRPSTTTGK